MLYIMISVAVIEPEQSMDHRDYVNTVDCSGLREQQLVTYHRVWYCENGTWRGH